MSHNNKFKFGMVIDIDKCIGCNSCVVACMSENNISVLQDETDKLRSITWIRIYKITNGKKFPNTETAFIPKLCMHCDNHTPCVSVCPATATDYDYTTGIVSQIPTRCIGCRYCVAACPYHARYFNWYDVQWPYGFDKLINPFVSPRMRGVVEKCTFCFHRYQLMKNKLLLDNKDVKYAAQYKPACVECCPTSAITFGDMNDADSDVNELINSKFSFRLLESLGTSPKVYYLSKKEWVKKWSDNCLLKDTK